MVRWPAVCWVESDGSTGIRLFMSVEEARAWQAGEWERHPDWEWVLDETMAVPGRSVFTIDREAAGSHAELVRKTLIRFYAEFCDCFLVRDWGTEALQPLSPFGQGGEPDRYGVATVIGAVTPEAARQLVRKNWFELFLWQDDACLFGLDDRTDVGFVLTEEWLVELEKLGVGRWVLKPESIEGQGYAFSRLHRPKLPGD